MGYLPSQGQKLLTHELTSAWEAPSRESFPNDVMRAGTLYKHCLSSSRNPKGFASYKSITKASMDPGSQRRDTRAGIYVGEKSEFRR